jgi:hypothetical protein
MVNWVDGDLWQRVTDLGWSEDLIQMDSDTISSLSAGKLAEGGIASVQSDTLRKFIRDTARLRLDAAVPHGLGEATTSMLMPLVAMSVKKEHEVRVMAHVCACVARTSGAECCAVDVGCGKGYLSK